LKVSQWSKSTLVAVVAVVISVLSLTATGIKESVATTTNHENRLTVVERNLVALTPIVNLTPVLSSQMTDISENLNLMRNSYNRQSRGFESIAKRTSGLEVETAVTNKTIANLTLAVSKLSTDTRELSRVTTSVEVLGAKLEALEESNRRSYRP